MAGVEPATSSLPRMRSTTELHQQHELLFATARKIRAYKNRAENGAQTRDPQLGRLVLYRLSYFRELTTTSATAILLWWEQMDSNHRRWKPADLQSAPFGRSGILPISISMFVFCWASCRIRTNDPEITNHVLWPTELKRRVTFRLVSPCLLTRRRKSGAKVLHFFELTKCFAKKMLFFCIFS